MLGVACDITAVLRGGNIIFILIGYLRMELYSQKKEKTMFSSTNEVNEFSAIGQEELEAVNGGFLASLLAGVGIGVVAVGMAVIGAEVVNRSKD